MYFHHSIHIIGCHGNGKIFISSCDFFLFSFFFFRGGGIGEVGGAQHLRFDKYDKLINQSVTISLAKSATLKTV